MPLNTKHRFLISPELRNQLILISIFIGALGRQFAALAACLAQGCPPKLRVLNLTTQAAAMTATGSERSRKIEQMDNPKQELRNETRRRRTLKRARIAFKDRWATIDCTVRNLSDRGACLNVGSYIGIPDTFDLVLDNAPVRGCRVTWRKATQIGIEFA